MTTIAWDGRTLAADKRTTLGTAVSRTTKIQRLQDLLVGGSGTMTSIKQMVDWLANGADAAKHPAKAGEDCNVMVVTGRGEVRLYQGNAFPIVIEDKFFAIGSGADFATAAMHLGKNAAEAVEIASLFDAHSGNGVDTLDLFIESPHD